MNKVEFIKVINEVVDYKLKKLIPEIENRITESIEKKYLLEKNREDNSKLIELMHEEKKPIKAPVPVKKIAGRSIEVDEETGIPNLHFTKNPILNKILNETMVSPPPKFQSPSAAMSSVLASRANELDEQIDEIPTMNFNTNNVQMPARASYMGQEGPEVQDADADELRQEIVAQSGDPNLANVMVKDYRAVLQKADEKAKRIRRSGGLPGVI